MRKKVQRSIEELTVAFSKRGECQEVRVSRMLKRKREEFQRSVEELKQWLSAKEAECQEVTRERDAQVKEKEEFQRSVEELKQWLSAKEAECQEATRERDAQVKEKEEFQRSVEELKQWLSAKEAECQEVT